MKSSARFGIVSGLALLFALSVLTFEPAPARAQVQPVKNVISAAQPADVAAGEGWGKLTNQGLDGPVNAIAQLGGDIVVGGDFNGTADGRVTDLNNIARFGNGAWHSLSHEGLNREVLSLTVTGGDLYVGGRFSRTADGQIKNLNSIAKYLNGQWSALPNNGFANDSHVSALTFAGGDLFAGGNFLHTADFTKTMWRIGILRNGGWAAAPQLGVHADVLALTHVATDVYLGGQFGATADPNDRKELFRIAELRDGEHWVAFPQNGLNNTVRALYVSRGILSVGGQFSGSEDGPFKASRFAQYNTRTRSWSYGAPPDIFNGFITAISAIDDTIFVGGNFDDRRENKNNPVHLAKFNNGTWSQVDNIGPNGAVRVLFTVGNTMYVGGSFSKTADGTISGMNNIATYTLP